MVAIACAQAVVRTFSRFVIFNVGRDIEYDLRNDLFAHLERLPLAFYQQRQTGDLMSRLVNDVTAVRMLLGPGILNFINTPVAYVYGLAIMLSIDARLTLAALAVYPAALLVVKRTSRLLMERTLRVQEGLGELSSLVQENLSGIHVVKAYAARGARHRALRQRQRALPGPEPPPGAHPGLHRSGDEQSSAGRASFVVLFYGGQQGDRRRALGGRSGRLHRLSRPARLADDGARLDALDPAARAGGHAAAERALPGRAGDHEPARGDAARRRPR